MSGRKHGEVPAALSRLERRFADWRKTRKPGARIPERLWKSAAKLARDFGLNQTATVLKLDYYSLKRHVSEQASASASTAAFIELPSAPAVPANECIIELEDGAGQSMRMHWKGSGTPDLLALGRSFWNAE